jgi:hypothetical protein
LINLESYQAEIGQERKFNNEPQAVVQATKFLVPILSILLHLKGAKCSFWVLETIDYN